MEKSKIYNIFLILKKQGIYLKNFFITLRKVEKKREYKDEGKGSGTYFYI